MFKQSSCPNSQHKNQLLSDVFLIYNQLYCFMRAPNQQKQPQNNAYQDQNKQLRQLFEQRMRKRQLQQSKEIPYQFDEQLMQKSIKKEIVQCQSNPKKHQQDNKPDLPIPIYQNSVYFDSRQQKPNFFIKIFSLFNDDPSKPVKPVSQNVQTIFISTFGFEVETFDKILTSSSAKLYLINDNQIPQTKIIPNYSGMNNLTVILKAKKKGFNQYGVFHTKLWLIKFKTFLRVVVCTSNQHVMDWAVWTNSYWYQDFPLKQANNQVESEEKSKQNSFDFNKDFKQTLCYVLKEMEPSPNYLQSIGINIENYVFKNIKVILIPSIPGRHQVEEMQRQGIVKLKNIMKGFNKIEKPKITYNSTSLGMLDYETIKYIYDGFCPNSRPFDPQRFSLIYPTNRYIQEETGGQAQVLFLKNENYQKQKDFSHLILHRFDTNPENPILGCIPHLKVVFIEQQGNDKGIMYMGSHNMTKAAWGRLEKKDTQLYIANSQLGLLMFDVSKEEFKKWAPFEYPAKKYKAGDVPFVR